MAVSKSVKPTRKQLRDKADRMAGAMVRGRGYCQFGGLDKVRCGGGLQWAHIVGRSNYRLRWELYNALSLCAGHHVYYTHHPWEWQELIRTHFPDYYDKISAHRNEMFDGDYDRVITTLKEEYETITK